MKALEDTSSTGWLDFLNLKESFKFKPQKKDPTKFSKIQGEESKIPRKMEIFNLNGIEECLVSTAMTISTLLSVGLPQVGYIFSHIMTVDMNSKCRCMTGDTFTTSIISKGTANKNSSRGIMTCCAAIQMDTCDKISFTMAADTISGRHIRRIGGRVCLHCESMVVGMSVKIGCMALITSTTCEEVDSRITMSCNNQLACGCTVTVRTTVNTMDSCDKISFLMTGDTPGSCRDRE